MANVRMRYPLTFYGSSKCLTIILPKEKRTHWNSVYIHGQDMGFAVDCSNEAFDVNIL